MPLLMTILLITNIGRLLVDLVGRLRDFVQLAIGLTIAVVVAFLIVRIMTEFLKLNPFGRIYQTLRRPTDEVIDRMRSSRFYYPLKRSLGFDPSILMVLVSLAILWYVVSSMIYNLLSVLEYLGISLIFFGSGSVFRGARFLIGSLLLAAIFFLMSLMTIVFVNWIFGLLRRSSYWAMERLAPLLKIFEFGGIFTGWSFIILWIALSFAAFAVTAVFFS